MGGLDWICGGQNELSRWMGWAKNGDWVITQTTWPSFFKGFWMLIKKNVLINKKCFSLLVDGFLSNYLTQFCPISFCIKQYNKYEYCFFYADIHSSFHTHNEYKASWSTSHTFVTSTKASKEGVGFPLTSTIHWRA